MISKDLKKISEYLVSTGRYFVYYDETIEELTVAANLSALSTSTTGEKRSIQFHNDLTFKVVISDKSFLKKKDRSIHGRLTKKTIIENLESIIYDLIVGPVEDIPWNYAIQLGEHVWAWNLPNGVVFDETVEELFPGFIELAPPYIARHPSEDEIITRDDGSKIHIHEDGTYDLIDDSGEVLGSGAIKMGDTDWLPAASARAKKAGMFEALEDIWKRWYPKEEFTEEAFKNLPKRLLRDTATAICHDIELETREYCFGRGTAKSAVQEFSNKTILKLLSKFGIRDYEPITPFFKSEEDEEDNAEKGEAAPKVDKEPKEDHLTTVLHRTSRRRF